jgi:hypothetical protein
MAFPDRRRADPFGRLRLFRYCACWLASWLLVRWLMADGYYQCRTRAAATAWARRGCGWRKIAARHLEGGKAMLAVRIDQHGNRAARSLDQVRVPGIAGVHALSDSGRAGSKMALPAGTP